jgi:S-adenosylmethionine/arginine decarboxylase-like enzyme
MGSSLLGMTLAAAPAGPYSRCVTVSAAYTHLLADFVDVPPPQLRDTALVTGMLIAGASAAGLTAHGAPVVRVLPHDGVTGLFLLEGSHIAVHTFPDRGVLLLDVLAAATQDLQKAVDVFARRLSAREVRVDRRPRG